MPVTKCMTPITGVNAAIRQACGENLRRWIDETKKTKSWKVGDCVFSPAFIWECRGVTGIFCKYIRTKKYISSELIHAVCPVRKDNFMMGYSARTLRNLYQKVFIEAAKKAYCNTLVC